MPGSELIISDDEDRRFPMESRFGRNHDQLTFIKRLRGGRLRHLKHKLQHPQVLLPRSHSGSRSRENSIPGTPVLDNGSASPSPLPQAASPESQSRRQTLSNSAFSPAAATTGVVAGSIAGWSLIERAPQETESIYSVSVIVGFWLDKTFLPTDMHHYLLLLHV